MKPELIEEIAAANALQVEQAQQKSPSVMDQIGDTAIQLDSAGQIVEGVWFIAGYTAQGIGVVVEGVGAVLDAIPNLD